jgi:hypothetical protein
VVVLYLDGTNSRGIKDTQNVLVKHNTMPGFYTPVILSLDSGFAKALNETLQDSTGFVNGTYNGNGKDLREDLTKQFLGYRNWSWVTRRRTSQLC